MMGFIEGIITGSGLFSLLGTLIFWWRFRGKDKATVRQMDASSAKTLSESYGLKLDAEISIANEWRKINEELKKQMEAEREDCTNDMIRMERRLESHYERLLAEQNQKILFLTEEVKQLKDEKHGRESKSASSGNSEA